METGSNKPALITSGPSAVGDAWQIGSTGPPQVCLCCGLPFDRKTRILKGPYLHGPYIWVCSWCWRKPFLFFPDKVLSKNGKGWIPPRKDKPLVTTRNSVTV